VTVYIPLIILTLLAKRTKLNKIDEYYDQIEKENKNRITLKKLKRKLRTNHYLSL